MNGFGAALWSEMLKARRSLMAWLSAAAAAVLPLVAGLFMLILKDPEAARRMGLISTKAQIMAGTADWASFFSIVQQGVAIAGAVIFALITAWVFGSEFSSRTNTDLLALPTPRLSIVVAKLTLVLLWCLTLGLLIALLAMAVGSLVRIPGASTELTRNSLWLLLQITFLTAALMPLVALVASAGRGYLAPVGWALFTVAVAQIAAVLGWGDWIPWSVPALLSGAGGELSASLGTHSYLVIIGAFAFGLIATILWWQRADQSR